ncbi:hypothetical protein OG787_26805 [Streptomyces sp. NBC_00075]|uniref:hypothetical protein n=1 Tax=Streptomyces sp. NBC_00075 TaxID=2975641 RepID=UPI003244C650
MSSVARTLGRLLTAVLLSTAVALGPTAFSGPGAMAAPGAYIEINETHGPPGTVIGVRGGGFDDCYPESDEDSEGETTDWEPGTVELSMGDAAPATHVSVNDPESTAEAGTFESSLTVSDDAEPGDHQVTAECVTGPYSKAEKTFTVDTKEEAALTLDPAEGRPEAEFVADGSAFNCSSVDVAWDDTESLATAVPVSETGTFTERLQVPEGASEGTHTVRAVCTDYAKYGDDDADFTVLTSPTNETTSGNQTNGETTTGTTGETSTGTTGETNGETSTGTTGETNGETTTGTTGETNGETSTGTNGQVGGTSDGGTSDGGTVGGTGSVDSSTPVGLVVGPALGGVLLLAAAGLALVRHRQRGPRWVHDHVSTALRPGTARSAVREPYDTGPPTRTVRLEPHLDPGDQSVDGTDRG